MANTAFVSPAHADQAKPAAITIDIQVQKQVIHSFGASDAWTCQFVGKYWPLPKRREIADLLFSRDMDCKGNPKGIGLSMWRFNVGAGSAEQGDDSRISSPWHRAECFQNEDGSYNWEKQKGQQWFIEAAHARGVPYLLAFTNSPPVHFTANGIAHSDAGRSTLNIRTNALPDFASFLVDVAEHFGKKGTPIGYISPVNEPQWDWQNEKQEGTPASNAEIFDLSKLIAERLRDRQLQSKVVIAEAGALGYITEEKRGNPRGDQVRDWWSPSSPHYLGNLDQGVAKVISGHSYFTTWPISKQIAARQKVHDAIAKTDPELSFWQTEFCILEDNDETAHGWGRDLGMATALYIARVIHSDLTIANASHWSWWLAVSAADFKDGLVYIDSSTRRETRNRRADIELLKRDGRVLPSKTLWALGNYSRFVRPGMVRVGVSYSDHRTPMNAATSLMTSAYLDKKTRQLVVVLINSTQEAQPVTIANLGTDLRLRDNEIEIYTTSQNSDLARSVTTPDNITIPPRSIVTLVGGLE